MASRVLRGRKKIDYSKLHAGEEQDSEEEEFDFNADLEGERQLCGSFNEEDEMDYESLQDSDKEDGEISEQEESEGEDHEIEHCVKTGNLEKLKRILKNRENDCKVLEKEVKKERLKEQKSKEMRQVLSRLNKVSKTRRELRKSLASSRQNSPCRSPKPHSSGNYPGIFSSSKKKTDSRIVRPRSGTENTVEKQKEQHSEYSDVLNSVLKLKQGNEDYADRVANAMVATDNILALSQQEECKVGQSATVKGRTNRRLRNRGKTTKGKVRQGVDNEGANALFEVIDNFANKGNEQTQSNIAEALLAVLTGGNKEADSSTTDGGSEVREEEVRGEIRRKEKTLKL